MRTTLLKLFRKKRFYLILALIGLLWLAYDFLELRQSDDSLIESIRLQSPEVPIDVHYLFTAERHIRYLEVGRKREDLVVFVHGAPSSMGFWTRLLGDTSLSNRATLMAIDRPGYGFSGFGRPEVSVREQARYLAQILRPLRSDFRKIILHGSSYGATLAARLAMDFPALVDGLLLQSGSVAAGAEKTYPITYPTSHWTVRWLIPPSLQVANAEKLAHYAQLKEMENGWDKIRAATIIFHGKADGLIYPENASYVASRLKNLPFLWLRFFPGRGHDLMWTERPALKKALRLLLEVAPELPTFSGKATPLLTQTQKDEHASG